MNWSCIRDHEYVGPSCLDNPWTSSRSHPTRKVSFSGDWFCSKFKQIIFFRIIFLGREQELAANPALTQSRKSVNKWSGDASLLSSSFTRIANPLAQALLHKTKRRSWKSLKEAKLSSNQAASFKRCVPSRTALFTIQLSSSPVQVPAWAVTVQRCKDRNKGKSSQSQDHNQDWIVYLYSAQYLHVVQDSKHYMTYIRLHKYSPALKTLTFL